jgi:hypothetical protein
MRMVAHQIKSNDHPPDFKHIEFLVSFWENQDSPSFITTFLEKKKGTTSAAIKGLAIKRAREFLSRIEPLH